MKKTIQITISIIIVIALYVAWLFLHAVVEKLIPFNLSAWALATLVVTFYRKQAFNWLFNENT